MEVVFTGPDSHVYTVPAFYDGDGSGGLDGTVWKARFSPGDAGTWTYLTTSGEDSLDGLSGSFQVSENNGCQPPVVNSWLSFGQRIKRAPMSSFTQYLIHQYLCTKSTSR